MIERLSHRIDERLDERTSFAAAESGPGRRCCRTMTPTAPASSKEGTRRAHIG